MKRKINLIVLLVFVAANVITPFSYAGLEGVEENSEVLLESLNGENPTSGEIEMQGNAENPLPDDETGVDNENLNSESDLVGDDVQNKDIPKTDDEDSTMIDVPEESGLSDLEESGDKTDSKETDELDENVDVNNDIAVRSIKMRNSNLLGSPNPVKSVVYNEGNITYTDTNGKVFSGIGTITITSGSESITILDRNLGATEVFNNDYENPNSESYGYHFQWGNNYGFAPVENDSSDFALNEMVRNGRGEGYADTTENAWNNPYVSDEFIITEDMQDNPDGGWDTYNNDLWGGAEDFFNGLGDSTSDYKRQGPCPEGYHVPSARDFNKLIEMYHALSGDEVDLFDDGLGYNIECTSEESCDFISNFIETFKIPIAGYRSLEDATVYEMMESADDSYDPYTDSYNNPSIYLWTSSAIFSQSWSFSFYPLYQYLAVESMQDRGDARSIRCFKDSPLEDGGEPLVLQYETNGGSAMQAQTIPEGENAYLPGYTTHKDGATLIGWFNEDGSKKYSIGENGSALDLSMSSSSADDNGIIKIYAKWGHEVTFLDWDGTELAVLPVAEGENAVYSGTLVREGYIFSGWDVDISNVVSNITATALYNTAYVITWKDGDGNILKTVPVAEGEIPVYDGKTPTKSSSGNYKYTFNGKWLPELTGVFEETDYVAQFDEKLINNNGYSGGGGSGRGGSSNTYVKDDEPKDTSDNSKSDDKDDSNENDKELDENQLEISNQNKDAVSSGVIAENDTDKHDNNNGNNVVYSQEFVDAYEFSKENGITTTSSIENAKMYGNLTRIQMAKMLSQFSINVLGKKPDTTLNNKFNDVSEDLDKQYDDGVTLSFQLGIMGQNMPNNKFRPNDEVSRAEFVAAFSRMLYGTSDGEYRSTRNYYKPHMSKLYNEGIVSDTNPNMKERRGYVMIMLMRSIKSN